MYSELAAIRWRIWYIQRIFDDFFRGMICNIIVTVNKISGHWFMDENVRLRYRIASST